MKPPPPKHGALASRGVLPSSSIFSSPRVAVMVCNIVLGVAAFSSSSFVVAKGSGSEGLARHVACNHQPIGLIRSVARGPFRTTPRSIGPFPYCSSLPPVIPGASISVKVLSDPNFVDRNSQLPRTFSPHLRAAWRTFPGRTRRNLIKPECVCTRLRRRSGGGEVALLRSLCRFAA